MIQLCYIYSGTPLVRPSPFAPERWPFKRGSLSSGFKINTFMFRFTLFSGLSRGVGLSLGWPLKKSSTILLFVYLHIHFIFFLNQNITNLNDLEMILNYKEAPSQYDLRCLKATLNPNKERNKLMIIIESILNFQS